MFLIFKIKAKFLMLLFALLMPVFSATAQTDAFLAEAVMTAQHSEILSLLEQGADVNSAQGDGMTALHWAAFNDDLETVERLLIAGANTQALTRINQITPLWLAARTGNAEIIATLLAANSSPTLADNNGVTPLMMAASVGDSASITLLVNAGADANSTESVYRQTALIFAAANNRAQAINTLIDNAATVGAATEIRQAPGAIPVPNEDGSVEAPEPMGGLKAIHYAAREGHYESVVALLERGADINSLSADSTTPMMMALINGHFDLAMYLLEQGGDPSIATVAGGTPLFRVIDVKWAPKSFYPQPDTKQQKVGYLELISALLERGANPNTRINRELWYTGYGFGLEGLNPTGATPFWRAAQVGDVNAMRLLVDAGADPTTEINEGVSPLLVLAGAGFHGNDAITIPAGRMPALRYLVEEIGVDVNAIDSIAGERTSTMHHVSRGYTAIHNAAARGDNEMILYLIERGGDPALQGPNEITSVDMANSPRERIEPFPETIALLMSLGVKNNNRCVSC